MLKQRNFILNAKENKEYISSKKAAILVHLYYEDTVEHYAHYLNNVPENIDVYITSSKEDVNKICEKFFKRKYTFIKCNNRGRDISSLLIASKEYLSEYDYVCFLHDKKEKIKEYADMTKCWIDGLWNNIIYNKTYINKIIELFDNNNNLGLLLPPIPIHPLNNQLLFDYWEADYDNTVKLAERIGLSVKIDSDERVIALGTVFWMRRDALKKLLEYPWKYDDFVDEPLPSDGTISHAIERILPYVAKDAGYDTAWVMNDDYASMYIDNMQQMIMDMFSILNKELEVKNWYQIKQYTGGCDDIIQFVKQYDRAYIYGTGIYGKRCYKILKYNNIDVFGFLVSEKTDEEYLFDVPVNDINNANITQRDCIIIAVSSKYRQEIAELLKNKKFDKNVIVYSSFPK